MFGQILYGIFSLYDTTAEYDSICRAGAQFVNNVNFLNLIIEDSTKKVLVWEMYLDNGDFYFVVLGLLKFDKVTVFLLQVVLKFVFALLSIFS